jgi:hypothetical protein
MSRIRPEHSHADDILPAADEVLSRLSIQAQLKQRDGANGARVKVDIDEIHLVNVRHFPIDLMTKILVLKILLPVVIQDLICKSVLPVGSFAHINAASEEYSYTVANGHLVQRGTVYELRVVQGGATCSR